MMPPKKAASRSLFLDVARREGEKRCIEPPSWQVVAFLTRKAMAI
jgi:hypothetical protein